MIKEKSQSIIYIITVLVRIFLLTIVGFGLMILISPESKALRVFLLWYSIFFIVIVLFAVYINYTSNIYKQIRGK